MFIKYPAVRPMLDVLFAFFMFRVFGKFVQRIFVKYIELFHKTFYKSNFSFFLFLSSHSRNIIRCDVEGQ